MLSQRIRNLKPSPTLALAAKAKELKAQGADVISLSVGEPDWDTFADIKEAGIAAIRDGATKYTPANGIPELRQAICAQTNADLGTAYGPDQVTVSAGGKFVIFSALQTLIDPGDEVVIPAPYWVSYPDMTVLAEGRPVIIPCRADSGFKLTPELLRQALTAKSKLLIINSPSNPTGVTYSGEELKALAAVVREHPRVVVLSDDIYNRLVFNESGLAPHLLQVAPDLAARTVVVNGVSKTYSMTGWRLGWALGPKEIVAGMSKYQSQSVSCAAAFTQAAAVAALRDGAQALKGVLPKLKSRRDFVIARLKSLPGIEVEAPMGAFYTWPDVSRYLGKTWRDRALQSSKDLAECLLAGHNVAVVPGAEFGCEGYLRISYALSEERMGQAMDRLARFLKEVS